MLKGWSRLALALVLVLAAVPLRAQDRTKEREKERARVEARAQAEASRGWLGISFSQRKGMDGAVIEEVFPGSPAARAGLEEGDTILQWNGGSDVTASVGRHRLRPGETVKLRVRRGGRTRDVSVVAGEAPRRVRVSARDGDGHDIIIRIPDSSELRILADSLAFHADSMQQQLRLMLRDSLGPQLQAFRDRDLADIRLRARELTRELGPGGLVFGLNRGVAGAEFADLNPDLSDYFGTDRGVVVLKVAEDGPADDAGLRPGDVVVRADGQPVSGLADLRRQILRAQDRDRDHVELEIVRKGKHRSLTLEW